MPDTYVTVDVAFGIVEGAYIKSFLDAEGIPCELLQEGVGYGFAAGPMGEVQIRVPSKQAERALELINRYRASKNSADRSD